MFTRYARQGASSRVRFYAYQSRFAEAGIDCRFYPLLDDQYLLDLYARKPIGSIGLAGNFLRRAADLTALWKVDAVWIEAELFPFLPSMAERAIAAAGVPMIVDYDDAIFHKYDANASSLIRHFLGRKIDVVMSRAASVTAGNAYLASRAHAAGAKRVIDIPTPVTLEPEYTKPTPRAGNDRPIRIGWIGTPVTAKYLATVREPLAFVAAQRQIEIVVIGASTSPLDGLPVSYMPWSESTQQNLLSNLDIGIMPIDDTPWSRGKCAYKLLQYMSAGKPVIGSPVGMNCNVIVEGGNGFLPQTTEAWIEALLHLIDDPDLRLRMGAAGRRIVASGYTYDVIAPRLIELFKGLRVD